MKHIAYALLGVLIVVTLAMSCLADPEEAIDGSSDKLTVSGRIGTNSICASVCVKWQDFYVGSDTDLFLQRIWMRRSWKGLTLGGSIYLCVQDWQSSGIKLSRGSLYTTIDLIDAHPLLKNGIVVVSSSLTYSCTTYIESSISAVELDSEAKVGELTLTSGMRVDLASSRISGSLTGCLKIAHDKATITPTVSLWVGSCPLEIEYMKASVSIERRILLNDSLVPEDNESGCSAAQEDNGKLELDLNFAKFRGMGCDFASQVSYTCLIRGVGISLKPYISLTGRVDPIPYASFAFGMTVSW